MRVFLSHSSHDQTAVIQVHERLGSDIAWLGRAELEWGALFLEIISEALEEATDFLLFWSAHSARSEWVKLELNMAFIRMMEEQAIRLRVVQMDHTELPLHLKPFQFIDVSSSPDPVSRIVEAVNGIERAPLRPLRHQFLNRNSELSRLEAAVDDPQTYLVILGGFAGIGKHSLAREGLRRLFQGVRVVHVEIGEGTGLTEFALYLNALAREVSLGESLTAEELRVEIRLSLEEVVRSGRFLLVTNIQHWLDEDRVPLEPLLTILDTLGSIAGYRTQPCLMTSTRRIAPESTRDPGVCNIWLDGLPEDSVTVLVRLSYGLATGKELNEEQSRLVASQVYGHPVAAKLAAGLVAQFGVEYLQKYPREYVSLRRDLANSMLLDMNLFQSTSDIMKALAAADAPLPPTVLDALLKVDNEEFHRGIAQATSAGLIYHDQGKLRIHPLIAEHFYTLLHREDSSGFLTDLAQNVHVFAQEFEVGTAEFSLLLPALFRLYAAAGDWATAQSIRQDLRGELERAAIFHYRSRNYDLAWEYVEHALETQPPSWPMRLYKARILIRRESWGEADQVLNEILRERPDNISALHAQGWGLLRQKRFAEAIDIFAKVISQREHVSSLRDSAECLHALNRTEEALEFLSRAKRVDLNNPYVLDLEARIFEERGEWGLAFEAAYVAMVRDPNNWAFLHRLGRILVGQKRQGEALPYFEKAVELDPGQFTPHHALVATLIDFGDVQEADTQVAYLEPKTKTRTDKSLVEHLKARILIENGDLVEGFRLLEPQIRRRLNLLPNLGLYADAKLREFDRDRLDFPATASIALQQADQTVDRGLKIDNDNPFLLDLRQRIESRRLAVN